jgi:hypothetical protein
MMVSTTQWALSSMERAQLINIPAHTTLKSKFYGLPSDSFLIYIRNVRPVIAKKTLDVVLLLHHICVRVHLLP